jgi:uncharacterized protein DUF4397
MITSAFVDPIAGRSTVTRFTSLDHRRAAAIGSAVTVMLCALGLSLIGLPGTASAADPKVGYVRLAHLSPDTPAVDVYLSNLGSSKKPQVFPGVAYGTVSGYLPLPVGAYEVDMRLAGADASTPAVKTTSVTVTADHAYTVAGVGKNADLGLRVINDDLTSPMNGDAKVRVIQASVKAPVLDLSINGGTTVASAVKFATTTSYHVVKSGVLTLKVKPTGGGNSTNMHVTLHGDSVYSVLVLDGKSGLKPELLTDATRAGPVPKGPVDTGAGGTALTDKRFILPAAIVAGIALPLAAFLGFTGRRRRLAWTRQRAESGAR